MNPSELTPKQIIQFPDGNQAIVQIVDKTKKKVTFRYLTELAPLAATDLPVTERTGIRHLPSANASDSPVDPPPPLSTSMSQQHATVMCDFSDLVNAIVI